MRNELKFSPERSYKPLEGEIEAAWNTSDKHVNVLLVRAPNLLPSLATAMIYNPKLKVMLNAGYYDLATPYFEGVYELNQLQIPANLRANIETRFYESGHMVYAHEPSLKALHANVADFIRRASQPN